MTDDASILQRAATWRDAGLAVAIATVVSTWGSAPRRPGSQLAVSERGELVGSVSGGCVEAAVVSEARAAIADGRPRLVEYGVSHDRAWEVGLACGGTVQVLVEPVTGDLLAPLVADLAAKRPVVLATVLPSDDGGGERTPPRVPWQLVHPFDAAEPGDPALRTAARAAAEEDASRRVELAGEAWLLRPYLPPVRVVIVGAVHLAQALAPMVQLAGYDAVVVDPRRAFAAADRFPGVRVEAAWPDEALARIGLDRRTAVVTLTHDPKVDDPALAAALRSDAFYVGALGSERTQAARRARLRAEGLPEEAVARVHGPVGLRLGAVSPGEIAVAIVAELVRALRDARSGARVGCASDPREPPSAPVHAG